MRRAAGLVAALALVIVPGLAGGARAQPAAAPDAAAPAPSGTAAPALVVDELSGVVRDGQPLRLAVRVAGGADEGARLAVTLQRRTISRFDFQRAVDDGEDRATVGAVDVPLEMAPDGAAAAVVDVPLPELGVGAVVDATQGVYPLHVELVVDGEDGSRVLDELRTSVVLLAEPVGPPVRTALMVPVVGEVGLTGGGGVRIDPLAGDLSADGRLPQIASALAAAPEVALTVATDGIVVEEAAHAAAGFVAVDAAGTVEVPPAEPDVPPQEWGPAERGRQLLADVRTIVARPAVDQVALPYAAADLVALTRAGLDDEVRRAVAQGTRSVEELTGARPAPGVLWPLDGIDDPTLEVLDTGVDTLVLDAGELETPVEPGDVSPPAVRRVRTPRGSQTVAAVGDPWLGEVLARAGTPSSGSEDGAPVVAQRIIGETAAVYFERPYATQVRGLVLAPPGDWAASGADLGALVRGLAEAPWLAPVTVPQLVRDLPPAPGAERLDYPATAAARELDDGYLTALGAARHAVAALANVLGADDPTPARASRLLDLAASTQYRGPGAARGEELVAEVGAVAGRVADRIEVLPGPLVTLTSTDGQVPVTLLSSAPVPVQVRVRLEASRFTFPEGAERDEVTLAPGEARTLFFPAEALSPGATHPIAVVVSDGGGTELARQRLVVRSTTFSVAAVLITGGAGAFLTLWWVRDARSRRRQHVALATDGRPRRRTTVRSGTPPGEVTGPSRP